MMKGTFCFGDYMLDGINVFRQSAIKIAKDKIIYFDPYKIEKAMHDADIIFITHDHYDHFDVSSIENVRNNNTFIVAPFSLKDNILSIFNSEKVLLVEPNKEYEINGINFSTVPSYNVNSKFHPREKNWVGYLVNIAGYSYYIMGDTDDTFEARNVHPDVLFVPVGGTYTMNSLEAFVFTNYIKPKVAVPIHYKEVIGSEQDAQYFIDNLDSDIEGVILIP